MLPDQVGGDVLGGDPGLELRERRAQGGGQAVCSSGRSDSGSSAAVAVGQQRLAASVGVTGVLASQY